MLGLSLALPSARVAGSGAPADVNPAALALAHLNGVIALKGQTSTNMWPSSINLDTLTQPSVDASTGKRAYRFIHAPQGVAPRYDADLWGLAYRLGNSAAIAAVGAYYVDFKDNTKGQGSLAALPPWGEHMYYSQVAPGHPGPVWFEDATGITDWFNNTDREHHELRPVSPPWDHLWTLDATWTEALILAMAAHVDGGFDTTTGRFNRHADGADATSLPFLEAGGQLIDTFTWLTAKKTALGLSVDARWNATARKISDYINATAHGTTGLVRNQGNDTSRWDFTTATSEIGWLAVNMLLAYGRTGDSTYLTRAAAWTKAWVTQAWDSSANRYFGGLVWSTGAAADLTGETYTPGTHSNFWDAFFPQHDYLAQVGIACAQLYALTSDAAFSTACQRIATLCMEERPMPYLWDRTGLESTNHEGMALSETYARAIKFLATAGTNLSDATLTANALLMAQEAYIRFYHAGSGMFRSHAGSENRYDAVDRLPELFNAWLDVYPSGFNIITNPTLLGSFNFAGNTWADGSGSNVTSYLKLGPAITGPTLASLRGNPAPSWGLRARDFVQTTLANAITHGDYWSICVEAGATKAPGQLSHLTFQMQRGGSGSPTRFAVRSSADNFTANLAHDDLPINRSVEGQFTEVFINLQRSNLQGLENVEFRVYGYGGTAATTDLWFIDNIAVYGKETTSTGALNPDATAYFTAASITNSAKKAAYNTLILAAKKCGAWGKMDAWAVARNADSETAALTNIRVPAVVGTKAGGMTWASATGFTGNGTTGVIDTGLTFTINTPMFGQNNNHMASHVGNDVSSSSQTDLGTALTYIRGRNGSSIETRNSSANTDAGGSVATSAGRTTISRSVSTGYDVYRNGVFSHSVTRTSSAPAARKLFWGARTSTSTDTAAEFSTRQLCCLSSGYTLTVAEDAAMTAAEIAFFAS